MTEKSSQYCSSLYLRERLKTHEVQIGQLSLGGENPIRIQSMTTTDTMDTEASVKQSVRMIEAGCELVRLTAPSKNEAQNLREIKEELVKRGYNTPLVADIHFTPNAAEVAARIVEKVRVNPGNYADKKKFEEIEYTDKSYLLELERIEKKFTPLVLLCKEEKTIMRIGTNHGSLSDRILSRYGDTPEGMVESAMEFVRICEKHDFFDIVISMKASNTLVMVQAYRLLTARMILEGRCYPVHLGVTEAGEGEDGRIKSAVGIGALLEDGVGDTIRVSLTEAPEMEIPVAKKLLSRFTGNKTNLIKGDLPSLEYDPFTYKKRETSTVHNIGYAHPPVVIADYSHKKQLVPANFFGIGYSYSKQLDKWNIAEQAADLVYIGMNEINFALPGTLEVICDYENWKKRYSNSDGFIPMIDYVQLSEMEKEQKFFCKIEASEKEVPKELNEYQNAILVLHTACENKVQLFRKTYNEMLSKNVQTPVILCFDEDIEDSETFQLHASSVLGSLLIDGFGDGIWISSPQPLQLLNSTAFGILQATRTRISKTEYISCPSCGRTLFDLQETTAKIRERTSHLKGVKIGIMGCIVNGPGEMADADYGYVGTGPGKITLYKEKTVVRKNVQDTEAVDALIDLIRENGDWIDPN